VRQRGARLAAMPTQAVDASPAHALAAGGGGTGTTSATGAAGAAAPPCTPLLSSPPSGSLRLRLVSGACTAKVARQPADVSARCKDDRLCAEREAGCTCTAGSADGCGASGSGSGATGASVIQPAVGRNASGRPRSASGSTRALHATRRAWHRQDVSGQPHYARAPGRTLPPLVQRPPR
jgi:hypothetical protein